VDSLCRVRVIDPARRAEPAANSQHSPIHNHSVLDVSLPTLTSPISGLSNRGRTVPEVFNKTLRRRVTRSTRRVKSGCPLGGHQFSELARYSDEAATCQSGDTNF